LSLPDAATSQWITTTPALVCSVAVATGDALPTVFVSVVIAFAVAIPLAAAPNAVADRGHVATTAPGEPTVPDVRKTRLPDAPISAVTALVAALRAAVECVTAIAKTLWHYCCADHVKCFDITIFAGDGHGKLKLGWLAI
jgi:hypothetical protein